MRTVSFKEYQEILMNSFKKINEFFLDNDIKWWAHSGTLLGAVREQNIIEWDDDIDMTMTLYDWLQNKEKIETFLKEMNWVSYDTLETRGTDATRFFSKEKIKVEYKGKCYITKPFIDVMISIPVKGMGKTKRKIWSWFNQYNFIFSARYRLVPYYGWFGKEVKKINGFLNFLVWTQKMILYIFTFWVPHYHRRYLKKHSYVSSKVSMFYNYDNNGVVYSVDKISTKHKFGETEIYSSDDWKNELDSWFGINKWKELPPEWNRVPHHLLLTPSLENNNDKYKIEPYIII